MVVFDKFEKLFSHEQIKISM